MRKFGWAPLLLAILALACNAPLGDGTPSPPPPATSAETSPPTPTTTDTPTAEPSPDSEETPSNLPTFTPIQLTATAGATATPSPTPTEPATETPSTTPTEAADSGPLSFDYAIVWEVSNNPGIAIATVTISATGGGGDYRYFRDDLLVDGPIFQYEWATCRANPGSLRVDSADGQSVKVDYFETPPCPSTPGS